MQVFTHRRVVLQYDAYFGLMDSQLGTVDTEFGTVSREHQMVGSTIAGDNWGGGLDFRYRPRTFVPTLRRACALQKDSSLACDGGGSLWAFAFNSRTNGNLSARQGYGASSYAETRAAASILLHDF